MSNLMIKLMISVVQVDLQCQIQSRAGLGKSYVSEKQEGYCGSCSLLGVSVYCLQIHLRYLLESLYLGMTY